MLLIYANMPLGAVIEENPFLIPVLERFGISLGLGEKTVGQVCALRGIDPEFFLMVLNTFLNEDYFPQKQFAAFHLEQIVDYLRQTNAYYRQCQLVNVERHLDRFVASGRGENPSLKLIAEVFSRAKGWLLERMERDEREFFPRLVALCRAMDGQDALCLSVPSVEPDRGAAGECAWELLHDIKSVMVRHLHGPYDSNLCYAVLFAVAALEKDMRQHERIRYRILEPMARAMRERKENTRKPSDDSHA